MKIIYESQKILVLVKNLIKTLENVVFSNALYEFHRATTIQRIFDWEKLSYVINQLTEQAF